MKPPSSEDLRNRSAELREEIPQLKKEFANAPTVAQVAQESDEYIDKSGRLKREVEKELYEKNEEYEAVNAEIYRKLGIQPEGIDPKNN